MHPKINFDQGEEVLRRIWLAVTTGQHPFERYSVPQEYRNLPKNLTSPKDHGLFLYRMLMFMQSGIPSEPAFNRMRILHEAYPDLFSAEGALCYSKKEIRELIVWAGLTHYNSRPEWWLFNSNVLLDHWDGDPRNIYRNLPSDPTDCWEEVLNRTTRKPARTKGAGKKVAAMGIHFFVDAALVSPVNCPPPIDFRQTRLFGATGVVWSDPVIRPGKEIDLFKRSIREVYFNFSEKYGVSMLEIGEAVWVFAGVMCSFVLGNQQETRRGWNKPISETCGKCFLADLCKWTANQKSNYGNGGGIVFKKRNGNFIRFEFDPTAVPKPRCTKHRELWTPDPALV